MHGIVPKPELRATIRTATTRRKGVGLRRFRDRGDFSPGWFAILGRKLWPEKTAAHLHFLTGASERTCRDWAPERPDDTPREPPAFVLAELLRGEQGGRVLGAVMDGSKAEWWERHQRADQLAEVFDAQCAAVGVQLSLPLK
jgi:hypothetical protein